ncbi:unnamed protein product, partial [Rotaria sordida]
MTQEVPADVSTSPTTNQPVGDIIPYWTRRANPASNPEYHILQGRSTDIAWFSIVDDEWLQVKQEIQRWLNPDNFDANGQQLSKLNSAQANPRS